MDCQRVQDEILEMDEFTIDPERGTGISKMGSLDPPCSDGRTGNPLIETG